MNATVRDTVALAVAGTVLVALALGGHAEDAQTTSISSTYDAGRNGYRALYRVLESAHVPVRQLRRSLTTMMPGGTLVLSDNSSDPAPIAFDKTDRAALSRFVSGGGRLVVLSGDFDGMRDVVPHAPKTSDANVGIAIASNALRTAAGVRTVELSGGVGVRTFRRCDAASGLARRRSRRRCISQRQGLGDCGHVAGSVRERTPRQTR